MSRTKRSEPSDPAWFRQPRGKQSERKRIERSADEYDSEGLTQHKTRQAIPPDAWDDLPVSYRRGQKWHRLERERWR